MKINSIYNALGSVDDKFVSEAETAAINKKRPIAFVIAVCAAAMAAVSLLVGFRINRGVSVSTMGYKVKNSEPVIFDLPLKAKDLKISDEIIAQFEDDHYAGIEVPDELYENFGVEPLINENFIFNNRFVHDIHKQDMANIEISSAWGYVGYYHLGYSFFLRNVNTGSSLELEEVHFSDPDHYGLNVGVFKFEEDDIFEVLTLNDGSPCIAKSDSAYFAYDGSLYRFFMFDSDEDPSTLEKVKTVLTDLGVLG